MQTTNPRILWLLLAECAILAIANNLRVPSECRVSWFGGQPVFPGPEVSQP